MPQTEPSSVFTDEFIQARKVALDEKLDECLKRQKKSLLEIKIGSSRRADDVDESASAQDREVAVAQLNGCGHLMPTIRAALFKLKHGGYGVCIDCEENISEKRLKATPWAERCISCAEEHDKTSAGERFR